MHNLILSNALNRTIRKGWTVQQTNNRLVKKGRSEKNPPVVWGEQIIKLLSSANITEPKFTTVALVIRPLTHQKPNWTNYMHSAGGFLLSIIRVHCSTGSRQRSFYYSSVVVCAWSWPDISYTSIRDTFVQWHWSTLHSPGKRFQQHWYVPFYLYGRAGWLHLHDDIRENIYQGSAIDSVAFD